jgi:hypothetical protein
VSLTHFPALKHLGTGVAVVLVLALSAARAEAGFNATLNSVTTNNGNYVTVTVQNTNTPNFGENVIAGQLNWTATSAVGGLTGAGNRFGTFCIEIPRDVYLGSTFTLAQTDLTALPTSGPSLTVPKVAQIQALWAASRGSLATGTDYAAFQLAIWEIVYENGSTYNVSAGQGNFTARNNAAVTAKANQYLQTVNGSQFVNGVLVNNGTELARANVVGFRVTQNGAGDYQDQIAEIAPTPAPPALVLVLSGLLPLLAFRRQLLNRAA